MADPVRPNALVSRGAPTGSGPIPEGLSPTVPSPSTGSIVVADGRDPARSTVGAVPGSSPTLPAPSATPLRAVRTAATSESPSVLPYRTNDISEEDAAKMVAE